MVSPRSGPPALVADVSEDARGARLSEDDIAEFANTGSTSCLTSRPSIWAERWRWRPSMASGRAMTASLAAMTVCRRWSPRCATAKTSPTRSSAVAGRPMARRESCAAVVSSSTTNRWLGRVPPVPGIPHNMSSEVCGRWKNTVEFLATAEDFGEVDHYRLPGLARAGAATATRLATRIARAVCSVGPSGVLAASNLPSQCDPGKRSIPGPASTACDGLFLRGATICRPLSL